MIKMVFEIDNKGNAFVDYNKLDYKNIHKTLEFFLESFKQKCKNLSIIISEEDLEEMHSLLNKLGQLSFKEESKKNDLICVDYLKSIGYISEKYMIDEMDIIVA